MKSLDTDSVFGSKPEESKKRRREWLIVAILALVFLGLSGLAFRVFDYSKTLPFEYSVFFFGLVNFNIILFLLMMFLIFRNIVKVFAEKRDGLIGSSLKSKLIAAFVSFSFVPTTLMFLISVFYINNSFDRWFSEKNVGILKSSLEVTDAYYVSAKKRNYHFANEIKESLLKRPPSQIPKLLEASVNRFRLDSVEFYPGLFDERIVAVADGGALNEVPEVSLEFRKKGVEKKAESSMIHHFEKGNLVRVIVPVEYRNKPAALVISSFVPLSLISRMDDIATAYENLKQSDPLSYPLKSIYLIILVLMTLVILLAATWFGFYLARQLSIPLELVGVASQRVAQGDYHQVQVQAGSSEIQSLVENFNQMSSNLEKSDEELRKVNTDLTKTLSQLNEHSRYIEVVLSNVTTGVISVDRQGVITMVNQHATQLLGIEQKDYVGQPVTEVMTQAQLKIFNEMLKSMKRHRVTTIQRELRTEIGQRAIPLHLNLSLLYDQEGEEIGKILVFDDLTVLVNAQRAAAWTEVAKRIAHEIKNPLTPIRLSAQRLNKKFSDQVNDKAFNECTEMIIEQVDDLKDLVNEFSTFARMPKSNPRMNDLNSVVVDTMVLFREAHKSIEFSLKTAEMPEFLFDGLQMKRALTNLFDNAVSAIEGIDRPTIKVETGFDSDLKLARVIVEDNGAGISPDMRGQVFEPYVTGKPSGTGLGLAIVKRSIEDHNGVIRAFDVQPRGTRFVIELPAVLVDSDLANNASSQDLDEDLNI